MRSALVLVVSALTVVSSCIGLTGCSTNPATGRTQLRLLPASEVNSLGAQAKPDLIREYGGEVPQAQLREYVAEVGNRLAAHVEPEYADIEWSFIVLNSDVINAFALPGGNVFISRGLLNRFTNESQLAGVLGHEIGHVTGRHVDERISQAVTAEIGLGVLGALTDSQLAILAAQLFSGGYQLSFGRNQEIESDTLGMRYMTAAGYDPHGMLEVMEILRDAAGGASQPEFLSTHPHPQTRIDTINRLLRRQYADTQNNPDYRKYQSRFEQRARPHLGPRQTGMASPESIAAMWCAHCGTSH